MRLDSSRLIRRGLIRRGLIRRRLIRRATGRRPLSLRLPRSPRLPLRRVLVVGSCAAVAAGVIGPAVSTSAAPRPVVSSRAAPRHGAVAIPARPPVTAGSSYLAIGDSVAFGYREATTSPPPNYARAASFVGYPEDVGAALGLKVANAACPGETSASLINAKAPSNGCESSPGGGPGYRSAYPLHVSYTGSQLKYAVGYLEAHPQTRLVSLMIGANDAFLCEATTKDHCATELPGVLKKISANVAHILKAVRTVAGYRGQIVIVNYYSLDYAVAADNVSSRLLNQAMDSAAKPFDVRTANGYQAFRVASLHSKRDTCTAGLLTQLTTGGCGVHPSVAGQALLAQAIERVVRK